MYKVIFKRTFDLCCILSSFSHKNDPPYSDPQYPIASFVDCVICNHKHLCQSKFSFPRLKNSVINEVRKKFVNTLSPGVRLCQCKLLGNMMNGKCYILHVNNSHVLCVRIWLIFIIIYKRKLSKHE